MIIGCMNSNNSNNNDKFLKDSILTLAKINTNSFRLKLSDDYGYIRKNEGLKFLLSNNLTDTLKSYWYQITDNDTIGKYYKKDNSKEYIICLIDLTAKITFETHLLMTINSEGNLIKSERFYHGNYPSCWSNRFEGFKKIGNLYFLKVCGTGSGYSSSKIYIFREIKPQTEQNPIVEGYWSSFSNDGLSEYLTSEMEIKNNYILMHYRIEKGELKLNDNFKPKTIKKFDVKYILVNNKWMATDSSELKKLMI